MLTGLSGGRFAVLVKVHHAVGRPAHLVTGLARAVASISHAATDASDVIGIASSVLSSTRIGAAT